MLGTPQTTFSLDNPAAKAGMLYDNSEDVHIANAVCGAAALDAGVVVEMVAGVLVLAQGTGNPDASTVYGITQYKDSIEGAAAGASTLPYQPGDNVPVIRKGRVYAQCVSGTTVGQRGAPANFNHSSTLVAGAAGLITSAAASGTVGSEISAFPNGTMTWFKDVGLTSATNPLVAVELNMP